MRLKLEQRRKQKFAPLPAKKVKTAYFSQDEAPSLADIRANAISTDKNICASGR
jgi:hypothetical protein